MFNFVTTTICSNLTSVSIMTPFPSHSALNWSYNKYITSQKWCYNKNASSSLNKVKHIDYFLAHCAMVQIFKCKFNGKIYCYM